MRGIYLGTFVACSWVAYRCIPLRSVLDRVMDGQGTDHSVVERIRMARQADTLDLAGILEGTVHWDKLVVEDIERG